MGQYNQKDASDETLQGLFKTKYGKIHKLCPKMFTLQRLAPWSEADKIGDKFAELALLQNEHGVTYAGPSEDAFDLAVPVAGQTKPTEVQGCQHVLRTYVGYNAVVSAVARGEEAFEATMDLVVSNINDSLRKRCEIDYFYGQDSGGLGIVSSVAGNTITFTEASWAPGIWAGAEGAVIQAFQTGLGAGSQRTNDATITSVDIAARSITCSGGLPTSTAATDIILFKGMYDNTAGSWKTCKGLHAIAFQSSGTLFNINVSYSLWKPSTYSAGSGQLTFQKVQKAIYRAMSKGYKGDMRLVLNPTTWADLLNDEAALRRHARGGVRQYEVGASGIKFYTAIGVITIEASIYVKEGFAYLIPEKKNRGWGYRRIGAKDVGWDTFGSGAPRIERVTSKSAFELRLYDNQALYTGRPGYTIGVNAIVNAV